MISDLTNSTLTAVYQTFERKKVFAYGLQPVCALFVIL